MPSRVLVVEDSLLFREQIVSILQQEELFESYLTAADGLEGLKLMTEERADFVISDLQMPRLNGLRFLQMMKSLPELSQIPFILLTGSEDREAKIQALEQGASDYVNKPFDPAELVARVRIHMRMKRLQDDLRAMNEHLRHLSTVDPLTTLFNRRFLTEILETELLRAKRLRSSLALLVVDIDHFKSVNDGFGHQMGDKVLVQVAETLRQGLRTYDIASRYGGEEFVLVLPGTGISGGVEVAERLRRATESLSFDDVADRVKVTVSIGVSSFSHEEGDSADALFARADQALYAAKNKGRNRVEAVATAAARQQVQ